MSATKITQLTSRAEQLSAAAFLFAVSGTSEELRDAADTHAYFSSTEEAAKQNNQRMFTNSKNNQIPEVVANTTSLKA